MQAERGASVEARTPASMERVRLAVTMGDPAGVGPEVVLKALCAPEARRAGRCVVFGDLGWMRQTADVLGLAVRVGPESGGAGDRAESGNADGGGVEIEVRQATEADLRGVKPGQLSAEAGRAAAESVISAARAVLAGAFDAVVTAPLNKEAIALGGYPFPGHTELLAHVTGCSRYAMLLASGPLRVIHVSTHVSLRQAIDRVRAPRVLECLVLGHEACVSLGIARPRLAVAGLNPHAGEGGLFGTEEAEEIAPAVREAVTRGLDVTGPLPPDTVFARAAAGEFDLVVAMYHDQGHIPVKLRGFDEGVNITVGLPLVRVSVDHGTAFDKAGRGVAREQSMLEAIRVASILARARRGGGGA